MTAWRLHPRSLRPAARAPRPSEHGQRRHHRLALQRADVLRGPVRGYFTIRAVVARTLWAQETAKLNVPFAAVNTTILVLSSLTCQLGVFAAERGQVGRTGSAAPGQAAGACASGSCSPTSWARSSSPARPPSTRAGPRGHHDPVVAVRLGVLPDHRLPRSARHRRPHRLPASSSAARSWPASSPTSRPSRAIVVSYYWHFVDVVWIGLFATIYLIQ